MVDVISPVGTLKQSCRVGKFWMQLSVWVMGIVKRFAVNIAVWIPSEIIWSPLVVCVCFPAGTNCPVLQRTQPALGEAVSLVFVCGLFVFLFCF